jgi:hypothetical protein
MRATEQLDDVIALMRMEYMEMPDLRLSLMQARRLWDIPTELCADALDRLVQSGFLAQMPDGSFLRRAAASERMEAVRRAS